MLVRVGELGRRLKLGTLEKKLVTLGTTPPMCHTREKIVTLGYNSCMLVRVGDLVALLHLHMLAGSPVITYREKWSH